MLSSARAEAVVAKKLEGPRRAFYFEREVKYEWLLTREINKTPWKRKFASSGKTFKKMFSPF